MTVVWCIDYADCPKLTCTEEQPWGVWLVFEFDCLPYGGASAFDVCLGIGDILSACRIHPEHLGDWNITKLDELANLRGSRPRAKCHNTRYEGLSNKELECLRSLERVFLHLSRDNTKKAVIPGENLFDLHSSGLDQMVGIGT